MFAEKCKFFSVVHVYSMNHKQVGTIVREYAKRQVLFVESKCVVPENIHTPPTEGH